MTVQQLIEALQKLPPDLIVVKDGYEDGSDNISAPNFPRNT